MNFLANYNRQSFTIEPELFNHFYTLSNRQQYSKVSIQIEAEDTFGRKSTNRLSTPIILDFRQNPVLDSNLEYTINDQTNTVTIAKQGEERETDFINIVAYSKLADFSKKYLSQGTQVNVVGRLQNRSYEDKNGTKKYISEIIAEEIYFADSKKKADESILWQNNSNDTQVSDTASHIDGLIDSADDLPF